MNRLPRIALLSALVGIAAVSQAFFFNSGVNPGPPATLISYDQLDSKFTVSKIGGAGANPNLWWTPFVVTPSPEGYPNAWIGDNTQPGTPIGLRSDASRWISPYVMSNDGQRARGTGLDSSVDGLYLYTYTFTLGEWEANWLNANGGIAGRWSSDNGSRVFWNNNLVGSIGIEQAFQQWSPFSLQNVNAGLNTLSFEVTNLAFSGSNPTGLRVEFTTDPAGIPPVPEPFTMALGAGALALAARKRMKRKQ